MIKKIITAGGIAYLAPLFVFAQVGLGGGGTDAQSILISIGDILDIVIPLIVVIALIYFLWGVAQYVLKQGDEEGQKQARGMMINGVIALFVIVSVWGLVAVLNATFDIDQGGGPDALPAVPTF